MIPDGAATQLLTVKDMAVLLQVSPWWLYQRTRLGQQAIPHIKVGRNVRFNPTEVLAFLRTQNRDGNRPSDGVS